MSCTKCNKDFTYECKECQNRLENAKKILENSNNFKYYYPMRDHYSKFNNTGVTVQVFCDLGICCSSLTDIASNAGIAWDLHRDKSFIRDDRPQARNPLESSVVPNLISGKCDACLKCMITYLKHKNLIKLNKPIFPKNVPKGDKKFNIINYGQLDSSENKKICERCKEKTKIFLNQNGVMCLSCVNVMTKALSPLPWFMPKYIK